MYYLIFDRNYSIIRKDNGSDNMNEDYISFIRRKIRNANLKFEGMYIGEKSNSYIKGLTSDTLVSKVKKELKNINTELFLP